MQKKRLSAAQKEEIRGSIGSDTDFELLIADAFDECPNVSHREIVKYIHSQYMRRGWFEDSQNSVAWFNRRLNRKELEIIIRNAVSGGMTESARLALEQVGRALTKQEVKTLMLEHTREGIDTFSKMLRRRGYRAILCQCVVIMVEKGDSQNARFLSNFILRKPLNSGFERSAGNLFSMAI